MGALFIPMLFVLIYLIIRDPGLLFKRINIREKEKTQKKIILLTSVIFLSALIISGLDFIFHWSAVPLWLVFISAIIVFIGYILYFIVMSRNSYVSRVAAMVCCILTPAETVGSFRQREQGMKINTSTRSANSR